VEQFGEALNDVTRNQSILAMDFQVISDYSFGGFWELPKYEVLGLLHLERAMRLSSSAFQYETYAGAN